MRSTILFILALISTNAFGQPSGEVFPDFTVNDIDGQTHHLQSYLDEGKTVMIDVFATWCPPCQGSVPGVEELHATYGPEGDDSMVVLSFERDPGTSDEQNFVDEYGMDSPVISEGTDLISGVWNINAQPRYMVICPDGSFTMLSGGGIYSNPQPIVDVYEDCPSSLGGLDYVLEDEFSLQQSVVTNEVRYTNAAEQLNYMLLDLTGAEVNSGLLPTGTGTLELGSIPPGMYLLQVTDGQSAITKRIVKTI